MTYDVVVVGSGPNGLSAAIELAGAGLSVCVFEAASTPGGGTRTEALTLPGFRHDVCSAVHPLGIGSPFFQTLGLERHGLEWIQPPAPLAHVMEDGRAVLLERSVEETARQLGADARTYARIMGPLARRFDAIGEEILGPVRAPRDPLLLAWFGWYALRSMKGFARLFQDRDAPALLAGIAAHAMVPLDGAGTASFALVLGLAGHAYGWPIPKGGSAAIADALVQVLRERGGELVLDTRIDRMEELPPARAYVFDLAPRQLLSIAGDALPPGYRRQLRQFRYGPGVFKMDWALDGPIPWKDPACARAATVHLSGSAEQLIAAEADVHAGGIADRPFVLLGQPSLFDRSRAPEGKATVWAYCHVPHGSDLDATTHIESHIEEHAPGFRDRIIARVTRNARQMEQHSPNYVGGDINGGIADLRQLFFRPVPRLDPYATPARNIFLCSSSTPPGGGVHGMCGYWAARTVLARAFRGRTVASTSATSATPMMTAGTDEGTTVLPHRNSV
jgi:phytoene dehydrogenase-like protein